jgi:hypothetical protein
MDDRKGRMIGHAANGPSDHPVSRTHALELEPTR